MGKKVTTEDFIEKANIVHEDKYEYPKTIYVKAIEKVIITCKIHGDFLQTPNAHLSGTGCSTCGHTNKNKWSKDDFIKELTRRCGENLPYEVIGEYTGTQNNILIQNSYGVCNIRANHLLNGVVAGVETSVNRTDYWINQVKEVHGDLYSYPNIKIINSKTKVIITCRIHGDFEQEANSHLNGRGCGKCTKVTGGLKKSEVYSKKFNDRASKFHENKYTYYENMVFKAKDYIPIICPIHGVFEQIADNHLRRDGCPKCGSIIANERMRENPIGWSHTNWQKAGEKSKNFDSFKVYIIKCWNDEEEFYKIGKTFTTVFKRFRSKSDLPYNYTVIKEISEKTAREISELENVLKTCNKNNKYIPVISFKGMYECFKELYTSCFEDLT